MDRVRLVSASADATHAYEAGLSYSAQRYLGGNSEALQAMSDGSRNVGAMYAYDNWAMLPRVRVGYGAQYARYDYLADASLLSPRASVTVQPSARDRLKLRAVVSHRETAPGAEEFTPPVYRPVAAAGADVLAGVARGRSGRSVSTTSKWPPNANGRALVIGVRAFRQDVDDQVVTLFGLALAGFRARRRPLSRRLGGRFRGARLGRQRQPGGVGRHSRVGRLHAVDHAVVRAMPATRLRSPALRAECAAEQRTHSRRDRDVRQRHRAVLDTAVRRLQAEQRVCDGRATRSPAALANARFNVQVNQSLPFISFERELGNARGGQQPVSRRRVRWIGLRRVARRASAEARARRRDRPVLACAAATARRCSLGCCSEAGRWRAMFAPLCQLFSARFCAPSDWMNGSILCC